MRLSDWSSDVGSSVLAWLLRRLGLRRARLPELGWFAAVGVVGAPLGAAVVVAVTEILVLDASGEAAFDAAWTFWIGDAVAIPTIVPTLLILDAHYRGAGRAPRLPAPLSPRLAPAPQGLHRVVTPATP